MTLSTRKDSKRHLERAQSVLVVEFVFAKIMQLVRMGCFRSEGKFIFLMTLDGKQELSKSIMIQNSLVLMEEIKRMK